MIARIASCCLFALLCLVTLPPTTAAPAASTSAPTTTAPLRPELFLNPPTEYRPVDCWWWDYGYLTHERLKWQIEEMHDKGVGGTWLYPRFGAGQHQSSEPGFFTEGWWQFVDFALAEHERLGMTQWANDWLGRLTKNYFQEQLLAMRDEVPELTGHRLVFFQQTSSDAEDLTIELPKEGTLVTAAAYRLVEGEGEVHDLDSRVELADSVKEGTLRWKAPGKGWTLTAVVSEPSGLNYLEPVVAKHWIDLYFDQYEKHLKGRLGKSLTAYGPDERQVLNGAFLYSPSLRQRVEDECGYDPQPMLAGLFIDLGPRTEQLRCNYHRNVVTLLEENLYGPIQMWLHDRGMKQATIATWGRENIKGQTFNYGDFFRMMRYFDVTGNEDSAANGNIAFIDAKLSSSIAHLQTGKRVAVCGYWGTGWGYTPEQQLRRTNCNFALGVNLVNIHGGMYTLMGSHNEFVPPAVHFFQPYWQTWRTFNDNVSRICYALSQGSHRADVAIVYPQSTIHASWIGGGSERRAFLQPAHDAEHAMFSLGKEIYRQAIDFDFVDETSIAEANVHDGRLCPGDLKLSVVILPCMSTIRSDMLEKLEQFVESGGTLIVWERVPTASAELGRDDPHVRQVWQTLLGPDALVAATTTPAEDFVKVARGKGNTILVTNPKTDVTQVIREAIDVDFQVNASDIIYTHNQAGDQQIYYVVNDSEEPRTVEVKLRSQGVPELWNAHDGTRAALKAYCASEGGLKMELAFTPYEGKLIVVEPGTPPAHVAETTLALVEEVQPQKTGFAVIGIPARNVPAEATVQRGDQFFSGKFTGKSYRDAVKLDGDWQCEYVPTMNNRWGDFRYPASNVVLGPEMPVVQYREETTARPEWQSSTLDESPWKTVKCGYGPYWNQLGPFKTDADSPEFAEQLVEYKGSLGKLPNPDGVEAEWSTNSYSREYGAERMDVHQQTAYDGLGIASNDFLVLDRLNKSNSVCYLTTNIEAPQAGEYYLHFGRSSDDMARAAWVNGKRVVEVNSDGGASVAKVSLDKGMNRVVLRIELPPRSNHGGVRSSGLPSIPPSGARIQTYAVLLDTEEDPTAERFVPMMKWHNLDTLPRDYRDANDEVYAWYRFEAPPGTTSAKLHLLADDIEAWVNGKPAEVTDGEVVFPSSDNTATPVAQVALRCKQRPGHYEGAAFAQPIEFRTARGAIKLGDWCNQSLEYYSGGLNYLRQVTLTPEQAGSHIELDLGDVRASATVRVNGEVVDTKVAGPFTFDLTGRLRPGENEIEVLVYNTLANTMSAQPTRYVYKGQTVSGLLGPVELKCVKPVTIVCE